jgi:hypothetical protein
VIPFIFHLNKSGLIYYPSPMKGYYGGFVYQHKRCGVCEYLSNTQKRSLKLIQTGQIKETLFDLYQNAKYIPRYI